MDISLANHYLGVIECLQITKDKDEEGDQPGFLAGFTVKNAIPDGEVVISPITLSK